MTEERMLQCTSCGTEFPFSVEEQAFYAEKGFQEPKRCKPCRDAVKAQKQQSRYGGGGNYRSERPMYEVQCSACGQPAQVPFQPKGDRPVYCRSCYADSFPS
jgi:CxxC-x17-CxxC domain-containing protein